MKALEDRKFVDHSFEWAMQTKHRDVSDFCPKWGCKINTKHPAAQNKIEVLFYWKNGWVLNVFLFFCCGLDYHSLETTPRLRFNSSYHRCFLFIPGFRYSKISPNFCGKNLHQDSGGDIINPRQILRPHSQHGDVHGIPTDHIWRPCCDSLLLSTKMRIFDMAMRENGRWPTKITTLW